MESPHNYVLFPLPPAESRRAKQRSDRNRLLGVFAVLGVAAVVCAVVLHLTNTNTQGHSNVNKHATTTLSDDGVVVKVANGQQVELAVGSATGFRVTVSFTGVPVAKDSPMIGDQTAKPQYNVFYNADLVGIRTEFGSVTVNSTGGQIALYDSNNASLTSAVAFTKSGFAASKDTCANAQSGYDVNNPQRTPSCPNGLMVNSQNDCCGACNNDNDCTVWVYASPGHEDKGHNCWLLMGSSVDIRQADGRVSGGNVKTPPRTIGVSFGKTQGETFYGSGCGSGDANTLPQTGAYPKVDNTQFYTPHYHSSRGYSILVVSPNDFRSEDVDAYPAKWDATSQNSVEWEVEGDSVDLYLIPAKTQGDAIANYWDLTGRPAVPPRYAFGFLACRWGWKDYNYVNDMMSQFRSGNYPIDAWISDFEWYTPNPDYNLPDTGAPDFQDFTYNSVVFPDPVNNLKDYRSKFNLRFGGIRKPRLGNSDLITMAKSKGWSLVKAGGSNGGPRNLNYSIEAVRDWYIDQTAHFLTDGVEFYWNDEGETFYFAFHWWNRAQFDGLAKHDAKKRFFTINRSYTPGMQRLGATVWTGDIQVTWDALRQQPGYMINWGLAGAPYVTCDTGGFNGGDTDALLLTRWYQVAAFLPIMRVHSSLNNIPHFPFLYPADASDSMRKSMNLRYQLVPYHYSLAHAAYNKNGRPIFRPMMMEFSDASVQSTTSQWMDGESILVCPVMQDNNSTTCILPTGDWFSFATSNFVSGGQTLNLNNVPLDNIPMYVQSGSIIPLAPVVQYTDALPGGNLDVQIYTGRDATFVMVEDDGESTDYTKGTTRVTTFTWSDSTKVLSWLVQGSFADSHTFTALQATAFFKGSSQTSTVVPLSTGGSVQF